MPRRSGLNTVHPAYQQETYFNDDHFPRYGHSRPDPRRAKPGRPLRPPRGARPRRRASRYEASDDGNIVRQSTAAAFYNGVVSTFSRQRPRTITPSDRMPDDDALELGSIHTLDSEIAPSPALQRRTDLPAASELPRPRNTSHDYDDIANPPPHGRPSQVRFALEQSPRRAREEYDDPVRRKMLAQVKDNKRRAPQRRKTLSKSARKRNARRELRAMSEKRPLFLWYATAVMIIVQVAVLLTYKIAPFGLKSDSEPNANIFYGPLDEDLVLLGALYPPCVRLDSSIQEEIIDPQTEAEDRFGCCVDFSLFGSGCWSSLPADCPNSSATVSFIPGQKCGGPHCCNDPEFWPNCQFRPDQSETRDSCLCVREEDVQSPRRPCCFGLAGQCKILSQQDCESDLLNGVWHQDLELCSQAKCLEGVCGLGGFGGDKPDQWYRLILAIWLHTGVLHVLFVLLFFHMIAPDVERLAGWFRFGLIFFISGIGGFCVTALFARFAVTMGASGACFGVMGAVLVELVQKWRLLNNPKQQLFKLLLLVIFMLGLGTLPYIDQFAHVGGLAFGTLTAIAVLPSVSINKSGRSRSHEIVRILCGVGVVVLLGVAFSLLYTESYPKCDWCQAADCINYMPGICDTHTKDPNELETE
eukprot:TRINITY_DN10777_c0_g1_i4.p1 TRINITY_DN10777_c0_g1~~TRINITY_DN10777_c0_g1_i4.p1  ORF type:complete len:642 (+),score=70.98 TRINITY_DN10777_c0_g1_i4:133-2058(+)